MKNETYNKLKWLAITGLPAIATLAGTVGTAVSWQHTGLTVIVITALDTCLGTMLGISSINYNKDNTGE